MFRTPSNISGGAFFAKIVNGLKVEADMVLNTPAFVVYIPANLYLSKFNNRKSRERYKKRSKLVIKTPEQRQ